MQEFLSMTALECETVQVTKWRHKPRLSKLRHNPLHKACTDGICVCIVYGFKNIIVQLYTHKVCSNVNMYCRQRLWPMTKGRPIPSTERAHEETATLVF